MCMSSCTSWRMERVVRSRCKPSSLRFPANLSLHHKLQQGRPPRLSDRAGKRTHSCFPTRLLCHTCQDNTVQMSFPLVMAFAPEYCNMQGARHVGNARLPIIHYDRESPEQTPDADYPCTPVPSGVALELSTWKADHEASSYLASAGTHPSTITKIASTFHGTESHDLCNTAATVGEMQTSARGCLKAMAAFAD